MDSGTQNLAGADETRAPLLIGMASGVLTLTLVFVLLRAYVRAIVLKKWGPDDTLVIVAFCFVLFTGVVFSVCTRYGFGSHIWTIPTGVQQTGRRLTIAATLGYHVTFSVIKAAFLLQYRRVFPLPKFQLFCDIMLGFTIMFGTATVVSSIVISAPSWRGDTFARERYNQSAWWLSTAVVHLVTDIIIFIMPIPLLNSLTLRTIQKVALICSFGLGFITTGISVVRISTLPHTFTNDVTWTIIPALVWSIVELCCAIMCVCIPTLRPLLRLGMFGGADYTRQSSEASAEARYTRKPFKSGTFGSRHSRPSSMSATTNAEPKTPTQMTFGGSGLTIMRDTSPAWTARFSDDGSEMYRSVDEVATSLSPPPKPYVSPRKPSS